MLLGLVLAIACYFVYKLSNHLDAARTSEQLRLLANREQGLIAALQVRLVVPIFCNHKNRKKLVCSASGSHGEN